MIGLRKRASQTIVDQIRILVKGGNGGPGLPRYGGIGGKGGDIYLKGSEKVADLRSVQNMHPKMFKAGNGEASRRTSLIGKPGNDIELWVPLGVTIEDNRKQYIGDINTQSDRIIVAMGGRGGDKFNDNQGFVGQSRSIVLTLKMISDAVLVGFPNAGKSSLLRAISKATPKVASYPFTTLKPKLGSIHYKDLRQIKVADLPGLVEGAHMNLGLGHTFLRHIVRTKLLVFVIDINDVDLGPNYPQRSPLETLCILNKEIELYDDRILGKPSILLLTKMDTVADGDERFKQIVNQYNALKDGPKSDLISDENLLPSRLVDMKRILPVSSESGMNIDNLKSSIREVLDEYAELERDNEFTTYAELQASENNRLVS